MGPSEEGMKKRAGRLVAAQLTLWSACSHLCGVQSCFPFSHPAPIPLKDCITVPELKAHT